MKALIIIAALLLTGCGDYKSPGDKANEIARTNHALVYVAMDDGMRCVKYMFNGGITCDWNHKPAELIKFYTIPGYDCETGPIPGHCTKWNITQAAYDKDFFNVTSD